MRYLAIALGCVLLAATPWASSASSVVTSDPNKVQIVTSDIAHFWRAYASALL